ncbi:hypothetical protein cyc_05269 [Cyclospora cayetanensis]|uniref:Uncharacterized protein n=1 Tax=Cyclospora cayetanensis TaxID=88456 RepID=A0A1D3D7H3_9EIME|nr:hypothetical protein cyc_05269 [Cyclospora cayetanensis]
MLAAGGALASALTETSPVVSSRIVGIPELRQTQPFAPPRSHPLKCTPAVRQLSRCSSLELAKQPSESEGGAVHTLIATISLEGMCGEAAFRKASRRQTRVEAAARHSSLDRLSGGFLPPARPLRRKTMQLLQPQTLPTSRSPLEAAGAEGASLCARLADATRRAAFLPLAAESVVPPACLRSLKTTKKTLEALAWRQKQQQQQQQQQHAPTGRQTRHT